jgi:hypothetical protein
LTPLIDVITRRICKECNTGWLHKMEDRTIPIIEPMMFDQPRVLYPRAQRQLAIWFTKMMLNIDLVRAGPDPRAAFRSEDYTRFFHKPEPFPGLSLSLGVYSGMECASIYAQRGIRINEPKRPAPLIPGIPNGYFTTANFYRCLLVASHHVGGEVVTLNYTDHLAAGLLRIWPAQPEVRWPPNMAFGDDTLNMIPGLFAES